MNVIAYLRPPIAFRQKAEDLVGDFSNSFIDRKPFPEYHCTLMTADLDHEGIDYVLRGLDRVHFNPFNVKVDKLCLYPQPNLVNLAVELRKSKGMDDLQRSIKNKFIDWVDFSGEIPPNFKEDFRPHVTLAYKKPGNNNSIINQGDIFRGIDWSCNTFKVAVHGDHKVKEKYTFPQ
jgi:2'-5' RNA ligase